MTLSNP